jgi:glycosyltransferase involved in cell wall biosynthesis
MTRKRFDDERFFMTTGTPPKALLVDLSHQFGGSSTRVLGLLSALPQGQAGLAAIQGSPVFEQAKRMGLVVHPVGTAKTDLRILPNLVRVIREQGYQVLDTQNIQSKFWGSLAALWSGAALVSTLNSWYDFEHGGNWKGKLYTALELATNFRLGGYIVVSETVRDAVQAAHKKSPVALIYNAVGLDVGSIEGDRQWLAETFGVPREALVCLAVGRLVWAKGYEDLLDAMRMVIAEDSSLYCLVIGEGELRAVLEEKIRKNNLGGRVVLAGYRTRDVVLSALKASDIFVMSSRQEGTPIALLEAAAMGVPILASACGGIPEMVSDGQQALLVPPGNAPILAQALLRLAKNPELRARLGQNAKAHIQQKFSLQAQARATLALYQKALVNR